MKAKILGILSAIFVSICCVGPIVLILLGLSALGIGTIIGKYHWWFLWLGIILIVIAWSYYFKEKKTCDFKGCQMENKKATQLILIGATIIVTFFVGLNLYTYVGKSTRKPTSPSVANLENIIIPVSGMTCVTCELTVSSTLKKIDGVFGATASAKDGNVNVAYDTTKTDINELIEAINKTGYKAGRSK